jgi:hypothetical protein
LLVLAVLIAPAFSRAKARSPQIECVNNLKQIGAAYRIWANDHGDQFPSDASETNGGWSDLLSRGNAGPDCWRNYAVMSNELGQSTHVLICPSDERKQAADFTAFTNNMGLSYFVGAHASDAYPQGILAGDRNLAPGIVPQKDYGFSPKSGQGNDVIIKGAVCWSFKMHSHGKGGGTGNILLGDGSASQDTSSAFRLNWLKPAMEAAQAAAHATNPVGIRLVFP